MRLFEFFRDLPLSAPEEGGLGYFPDIALTFNIFVGWLVFMFLYGTPADDDDKLFSVLFICSLVLPLVLGIYAPLGLRSAIFFGVALANVMVIVMHREDDPT